MHGLLESAILSKNLSMQKSSGITHKKGLTISNKEDNNEEKVLFCFQYQRNKCPHKGRHMPVVMSTIRQAHHISATFLC